MDGEGRNALYALWDNLAYTGSHIDGEDMPRIVGSLDALLKSGARADAKAANGENSWQAMERAIQVSMVLEDNSSLLEDTMRKYTALNQGQYLNANTSSASHSRTSLRF